MDLPLDHFRLLGVNPATDAQTVLRTLQIRLDRPPEQGYTVETLQARADLLRSSADLLSDPDRRSGYESDLTALLAAEEPLMPALEIPSSREVAGLLLLLEAGQPAEAFELASRALQPPQAPALGSSREADLTLLAGEAALAACEEQSRERHYEQAARTLQQGLQLLQRMGQLPELRERMQAELEALTPFRVLDLLSRDPASGQERDEGLTLLDQLVQRRGGLEGERDAAFASEDFQTFFKQIRSFLTVQEQLDLFQRWGRDGSPAAAFLATIALTASGFAQRKPERIATARDQLLAGGGEGIQPLLANLDLLLGDVEGAMQRFSSGAGPELRDWAERQSGDPLAQVCAWCRDWLSRDVLPGYRDLDADPDLEAYFSDRDVLAWVEREDRRSGRSFPAAGAADPSSSLPVSPDWPASRVLADAGAPADGLPGEDHRGAAAAAEPAVQESPQHRRSRPKRSWPPPMRLAAAAGLGLVLLGGALLLRPPAPAPQTEARPTPPSPPPPAAPRSAEPLATPAAGPARELPSSRPAPGPGAAASAGSLTPLTAAEPSESELKALLERWLDAKGRVLDGGTPPAGLDRLARPAVLQQLERQRAADRASGRRQRIEVTVTDVSLQERSPGRIALLAQLDYSDTSLTAGGRVLERTAPTRLRNVYVFGRDGDTWRVAATRPAS